MLASRPEIDWASLFGRRAPVEVEIGSGKGAFLVDYAAAHPRIDVVGIEIQRRWVRHVEARLARRPLPNVRIVCADAGLVFAAFIPDASVAAVHVYFPDPWWKRRHRKRRVVRATLAADIHRALAPGGSLHLATDVEERFEDMLAELGSMPFEVSRIAESDRAARPLTNFERKYRREGRRVYAAVLRKR